MDEMADSTWLEDHGFVWDEPECMHKMIGGANGIEVRITGDVSCRRRHKEGETRLSLHWECHYAHTGGLKVQPAMCVRDNPTRGHIIALFDALGDPLPPESL